MSIGINLRVTGHTSIGGRKYQEDFFSVAYQQTENDQSLEYAYFGIYDGHGGAEASLYAKEHLMNTIVSQKLFWSSNDEDVLKAIRGGYIQTHYSMWREQEKWPKTSSGLPSTAGTTASIAFIRQGKIYVGHVGDSGIVLGYQKEKDGSTDACKWGATALTEDHKPETYAEKMRIMSCGGKVVTKSGVPRVVWNRPRIGHKGPVRRSTPIDEIPFLAVARSLGDLWSYNSAVNEFIVSPNPDVSVIEIDPKKFRCLIFGTDGLWNVLSPKHAVEIVHAAEMENIRIALEGGCDWKNPSKMLVNEALVRWSKSNMKADNTSVVIIMLDPPGPPKRDVLRSMKTSIQPMDYENSMQNNINITLYDHTTRETIDLSQISCMQATESDIHNVAHQQYLASPMPTPYQDMVYSGSFAESYNSFLNTSLGNDHSYTNYTTTTHQYVLHHHPQMQPQDSSYRNSVDEHNLPYMEEAHMQDAHMEETYSLTNLQTKSERMRSEMMEASTSSHFAHVDNTENVAIVDNFHDYPLPSMSNHKMPHYENHFPRHPYQEHSHEQPTYQMERFDYHHNLHHHQEEPTGCNPSSQHYTSHDLSEHRYSSEMEEYLHGDDSSNDETICVQNTSTNDTCMVESTMQNDQPDESESLQYGNAEQSIIFPTHGTKNKTEQCVQINEISSSNSNHSSSTQAVVSQSYSDSGDEMSASSSTMGTTLILTKSAVKRNTTRIEKEKSRMKRTLKNIVKIVYETRSSQRPLRTRSQQENVNTNDDKKIQNNFRRFLTKNSNGSFLKFKRNKKSVNCNLADNNNVTSNNNNNDNNNKDNKTRTASGEVESIISLERRVLRSADQVKDLCVSSVIKTRRRGECSGKIVCPTNPRLPEKRLTMELTEVARRSPKRNILLRKVRQEALAPRVKR